MQIKRLRPQSNNFWDEINTPVMHGVKSVNGGQLAINVYDEKDSLVIEVSAPGIESKEKFSIELDSDNFLTVSLNDDNESESSEEKDGRIYHIKEISTSLRQVSISLPGHVDSDSAVASYNNGILKIKFNRAGRDEAKKITIA